MRLQPDNATDKTVVWSSDDENVATVSDDGTVTIKGVGNVTIKAEAGGKSASDTFVFYEEEDLGFYFNETENTYYIWNATGLLAWNAYVTTNGDYSNPGRLKTNAVLLDNITLLDNWTPVGTDTNRYTGTFEGGGHTISNLKINLPNTNDLGLFGGVAETGEVKNLTLSGVEISGSGCTGGIAGENHGTIENCSVSGSVSGTYGVGGIVGDNTGTIKACYNTGNVSGTEIGNSIGGIVGYNEGTIENCSISGSVLGICKVGGIAGCNGGTISGCNNKGKVSGTEAEFVGGIAGYSYEKITACYNTGEVSGHKEVGGIVGYNENGKKNSACYNTGNVLGFINIGGIAGDNYGTITACYWSVPEGSSITGIGYGSCSTTQVGENSVTWKAATSAMNDAISDWNIENSSKCDYQFVQKDGESEPPVLEKGAPATT